MKLLAFVLLLGLMVPTTWTQSQTSLESPAIEVVKFNWSKERIGWEADPFRGPIENFEEVRARTRNEKRIEDAKRGNSAEIDKIRREAKADAANIATQHKNTTRDTFLSIKQHLRTRRLRPLSFSTGITSFSMLTAILNSADDSLPVRKELDG